MHHQKGRTILSVVVLLGILFSFGTPLPAISQGPDQDPPPAPEVFTGAAPKTFSPVATPSTSSDVQAFDLPNKSALTGIESIDADIQFGSVPNSKPSWGGAGFPVDGCTAQNATGDTVTYILGDANASDTLGPAGFWGYNHRTNIWYQPAATNTPVDRWAPDWAYDAETNRCYLTGGATTSGSGNLKSAYMYNPIANTFTALPDFTTVRDFHDSWVGLIDNTKWLCIGGGINNLTNIGMTSTQCFNISANAWTPENAIVPAYPVETWGAADGVLNGSQFWTVAGIQGTGGKQSDVARYFDDADNQWHTAGNTGEPRYRVEGDFLNGAFYQMGGSEIGFTPTTDVRIGRLSGSGWTWSAGPVLVNARMDIVANAAGGTIWSVDGYGSNSTDYVDKLEDIPSHWTLSPNSFQVNILPDIQTTRTMTITNQGYLPIQWSMNVVLWDQPVSSVNPNAYVNQEFGANDSLNAYLADDFTSTVSWKISRIFTPGRFWYGGTSLLKASLLNWKIYADEGGKPKGYPGSNVAPVWQLSLPATDAQVAYTRWTDGLPSMTTLHLNTPISLPPGHYWLIFYPSMTIAEGGQYGRQLSDTTNGGIAQFINPLGGWSFGTSWQNWNVLAPAATQTDLAFRLEGAVSVNLPWLSVNPASGEIPAGASQAVTVTFKGAGLPVSKYSARLEVAVKDTLTPDAVIPVELNVVPALAASPAAIKIGLEPGTTGSKTIAITNPGYSQLSMMLHEIAELSLMGALTEQTNHGDGLPGESPNAGLTKNPAYLPDSPTTKGMFLEVAPSVYQPAAVGSILRTWPMVNMSFGWGVGLHGNVWISDATRRNNVEFEPLGSPTGQSWDNPLAGAWPADMAFDSRHHYMCQVNVSGDSSISCWDPKTGTVANSITGTFPWTTISQRGLAYRRSDDSFYIGGWNQGVIYHIQGLSGANPGAVISQCNPADSMISGLAYNPVADVLWEATNSATDTLYKLNPTTCASLGSLPNPQPGNNGAGLEMDEVGNLLAVGQAAKVMYLIDTDVPTYAEVPWMTETPMTSAVNSKASQPVSLNFISAGLSNGVYTAGLVFESADQKGIPVTVPVTFTVGLHSVEVTPVSLNAVLGQGLKKTLQLTIKNVGTGNKYFTVTHSAGWLSEDIASALVVPNGSQVVKILLNSEGLAPGTYTSNMVVQTTDPIRPEFQIPVTLKVNARVFLPAVIKR